MKLMNITKVALVPLATLIIGCNGNLEFRQMEQACKDKGGVYIYPNSKFTRATCNNSEIVEYKNIILTEEYIERVVAKNKNYTKNKKDNYDN